MSFLQPFFWVLILLGVMILIHELGHFWAALAVGVKVETFSIGFGPRLFGFKRGNTDFRVSAILFGGYVKMLGEQLGDEHAAEPGSFQSKPRWQRAIVILAGPFMNVLLAVALVTGLYMYAFPKEPNSTDPTITGIVPNSPAAAAGLQAGDKIISLSGKDDPDWEYVLTQEAFNADHPIPLVIDRHGEKRSLTITPKMDAQSGVGSVGWSGELNVEVGQVQRGTPAEQGGLEKGDVFTKVNGQAVVSPLTIQQAVAKAKGNTVQFQFMRKGELHNVGIAPRATGDSRMPWRIGITFRQPVQFVKLGFLPALGESLRFNQKNATMLFQVLGGIIERRVSTKTMSGPIGMAGMANEAAQAGTWNYLILMAVVSLQLAIFNLLPIPVLDGGTLLMLIIEMLMQREMSLQVKETIFKFGFVFLMMVVAFVIYNDISRILTKG